MARRLPVPALTSTRRNSKPKPKPKFKPKPKTQNPKIQTQKPKNPKTQKQNQKPKTKTKNQNQNQKPKPKPKNQNPKTKTSAPPRGARFTPQQAEDSSTINYSSERNQLGTRRYPNPAQFGTAPAFKPPIQTQSKNTHRMPNSPTQPPLLLLSAKRRIPVNRPLPESPMQHRQ